MSLNTTAWNRLRYTLYAPFYDLVARHLDRGRRRSIDLVAPRPGEHVLIVGGGTGLDLPHLPAGVEVTLVDLSAAMVRKASERARVLGLNARCEVMNAHALDLDDDAFDVVLLHLVVAVVPDPEATVREAARVLRPGGRVGVFDKFLPDDARPSWLRRAAGVVTDALFSNINRRLGPLLDLAGLEKTHEEPSLLGGVFKVATARKP